MFLRDERLDVNAKGQDDSTALHRAAFYGHDAIVQQLLVDPRLKSVNHVDNFGETAVMTALVNNRINSLRLLLASTMVNLDKTDKKGRGLRERFANIYNRCDAENHSQGEWEHSTCGSCGQCHKFEGKCSCRMPSC